MRKSILMSIQPYWGFLIIAKARGWEIEKYGLHEKTVDVRKREPKDPDWDKTVELYFSKDKKSLARIPEEYRKEVEALCGKVVAEFTCDKIENFYCAFVPYQLEDNLGYGRFIDNGVYKADCCQEGVVFERNDKFIGPMLNNNDLKEMCLSAQELFDYIGIGKHLYGLHISDLKVYDKSKELREFYRICAKELDDMRKTDDIEELCRYCYQTDYGKHASCVTPNGIEFCEGRYCDEAYKAYKDKNFRVTRPPTSWCYVEEV